MGDYDNDLETRERARIARQAQHWQGIEARKAARS